MLLVVDIVLFVVDALLQRSLAQMLDIVEMNTLMHKPDTPSSHPEYSQPDSQVYPRSQHC